MNINAILSLYNKNDKIILIFDHDLGGGTQRYRKALIRRYLASKYVVLLVLSQHHITSQSLVLKYIDSTKQVKSNVINAVNVFDYLPSQIFSKILINSLVSFKPVVPFIKQLLAFLSHQEKSQIEIMFHDYYPICPSYNLLNNHWQYCDVPPEVVCKKCREKHAITTLREQGIETWQSTWEKILNLSDAVIVFSHSSYDIALKAYPNIKNKLQVTPHSMDYFEAEEITIKPHKTINIGIVGDIKLHKGSRIVEALSRFIQCEKIPYQLKIIGSVEGVSKDNHVAITGPFANEELTGLIIKNQVDVFLFPSICPETFSYVIEELIALKQRIVCFELGAQAEKLQQYSLGRILPANSDMSTLINMINELHKEK